MQGPTAASVSSPGHGDSGGALGLALEPLALGQHTGILPAYATYLCPSGLLGTRWGPIPGSMSEVLGGGGGGGGHGSSKYSSMSLFHAVGLWSVGRSSGIGTHWEGVDSIGLHAPLLLRQIGRVRPGDLRGFRLVSDMQCLAQPRLMWSRSRRAYRLVAELVQPPLAQGVHALPSPSWPGQAHAGC